MTYYPVTATQLDPAALVPPPPTGWQLPYNGALVVPVLKALDSGAVLRNFLAYGAGDLWVLGNGSQQLQAYGYNVLVSASATTLDLCFQAGWGGYLGIYGRGAGILVDSTYAKIVGVPLLPGRPVSGDPGQSSPWSGCNGVKSFDFANANHALTADEYAAQRFEATGIAFTANRNCTYPAPTTDAEYYEKTVANKSAASAFGLIVTTGAGTTVSILPGTKARVSFSTTGTELLSTAI